MTSSEDLDLATVSLSVPADPEYLRLVRLTAADAGARADLSIEEIEDLRIAVDELAYTLIGEGRADATLTVHYASSPGVVEIDGTCEFGGEPMAMSDLSRRIVSAVVAEYAVGDESGTCRFRLLKRSAR